MGRRPITWRGRAMTAAERKQRQRDGERAKRAQAEFAFTREEEQRRRATAQVTKQEAHIVTAQVTEQTSHSVTSQVTVSASLNPTSTITGFDRLICNLCRKKWAEVEHMLIIAGRNGHGIVAVCNECSNELADDQEEAASKEAEMASDDPDDAGDPDDELARPFELSEDFEVDVAGPRGGVTRRVYRVHPLSLAIPPMTKRERERLRADIERDGVFMPLTIYRGKVLDGRERLNCASALGKPIKVEEFRGTEEQARRHLFNLNVCGRHLTQPAVLHLISRSSAHRTSNNVTSK
jgi:hypothetical protein